MQLSSEGSSSDEIHDAVLNAIKALNPSRDWTFADVGCGTAKFTSRMGDLFKFKEIFALDAHNYSNLQDSTIQFHEVNLERLEQIGMPQFDLITCIEVIEHLENPWQFTRGLNQLLKPGGHLIITTPNPESFRSLLCFFLRGYHVAFGERNRPAHKSAISVYDLKYMLGETMSFDSLSEHFIPNGLIPGMSLKWSRFLSDTNSKRFSDNYLISLTKKLEITHE